MRLFTGIDLPEAVLQPIQRVLDHLRPKAHLRWSPLYNLHITTKFIGEWPEERLADVTSTLHALPARPPFDIAVRNLGWFPNPHSPRVFWAGIHSEALPYLARDTDVALQPLGIKPESRAFSPHLTLARIASPVPLQPMREAIAQLDSVDFGTWQAPAFFLYRSQPGSAGSVYTQLERFAFAG